MILGIDPGFCFTGFGILKEEKGRSYLLEHGFLPLPTKESLVVRIGIFFDFFNERILKYGVTDIALETPFLGKNAQNFLKLGYLRGTLYLLANRHNLKLHEFSPPEIKQRITGYGGASKEQVARVILTLFPTMKAPAKNDVTDALAVTLCGLWHSQTPLLR